MQGRKDVLEQSNGTSGTAFLGTRPLLSVLPVRAIIGMVPAVRKLVPFFGGRLLGLCFEIQRPSLLSCLLSLPFPLPFFFIAFRLVTISSRCPLDDDGPTFSLSFFPVFSSPTIGFASNIITIIISTLTTASGLSPRPFLLSKRQDNCSSFLGVVGGGFFLKKAACRCAASSLCSCSCSCTCTCRGLSLPFVSGRGSDRAHASLSLQPHLLVLNTWFPQVVYVESKLKAFSAHSFFSSTYL